MSNIPAAADAVVVGSGVSGLSAAVTLAAGGAKVIVFEKERSLGGTSNFFQGTFAVESELQRQRYITYSRDQAFRNIMEYSHWRANPRLVRAIVDESSATIGWLMEHGVEFSDATNNMPDAPRTYHVVRGTGEAVVKALATNARELGVIIAPGTPVKQLLKSGEGITGVIIEENDEDVQVTAKAVVIASGGYANNREWVKKYAGYDLDTTVIPFGNVDKVGDGIRMSFEAGAADEGLGVLELVRSGPVAPEFAMGCQLEYAAVQPGLWVDNRGERFCDETIGFYDTAAGNASVRQPDGYTFSVFDSTLVRRLAEQGGDNSLNIDFPPGSPATELERELGAAVKAVSKEVFEADSVRELAEKMGTSPDVLQATVDEYNAFCNKGHDDLFAKEPKYLLPLEGPKFYAIRARTVFLGTLGGIKINHRTEVVDKKGRVIPGLYAVGYDAGGMYGDGYCVRDSSGLSSSFAMSSGRIAGRNALKYLGK